MEEVLEEKQHQSTVKSIKQSDASALKSFLSGGFGGMCLVLVGQPFDLIKVRLQATNLYSGAFHAFREIIRSEGIRGLYRGMSTPLLGVTPIFAVCFWGYDLGQRILKDLGWLNERATSSAMTERGLSIAGLVVAGGFSAIPTTLLMAPSERIKVILQVQDAQKRTFSGPVSVVKSLWKEGGLKSLYRGTGATLLRDVPGSMAYFGAYEVVKKLLSGGDPSNLDPAAVLIAGGCAGIANWSVAIPPDVIKSRLQTAPAGTYSGTFGCAMHLIKTEGPAALFKGLGPAVVRAFPANAACFFGVEFSSKMLDKIF